MDLFYQSWIVQIVHHFRIHLIDPSNIIAWLGMVYGYKRYYYIMFSFDRVPLGTANVFPFEV